jgi:hypothetical protein
MKLLYSYCENRKARNQEYWKRPLHHSESMTNFYLYSIENIFRRFRFFIMGRSFSREDVSIIYTCC